jgi:hypothetical protein
MMDEPVSKSPLDELLEELREARKDLRASRVVIRIGAIFIALLVVGFVWLWQVAADAEDAATTAAETAAALDETVVELKDTQAEITEVQKTGCENGNESRRATREFWLGLVLQSASESPEEARALRLLRDHVNIVWAERNCDDLNKEYPLPPFPDLRLD